MPPDREISDTERINWLRQHAVAHGDITLSSNFELNSFWVDFRDEETRPCRNYGKTLRSAIDSAILNPGIL